LFMYYAFKFFSILKMTFELFLFLFLVPKLQLGNPDSEAPASRDRKLELPTLNSQAGAWELALTKIFNLSAVPRNTIAITECFFVPFVDKSPFVFRFNRQFKIIL